jgi:hypothetical protein
MQIKIRLEAEKGVRCGGTLNARCLKYIYFHRNPTTMNIQGGK